MLVYFGDESIEVDKLSYAVAENIQIANSLSQLQDYISPGRIETILIIGSSVGLAEAVAMSEKIRMENPSVRILLVRARIDIDTLTRAMRAGIQEVLPADEPTAFARSIQHTREIIKATATVSSQRKEGRKKSKIIVVFSAKGGCGKTTVSINLAAALSRINESKVCLIDLDLQFGDVGVSLQQNTEKTISSAISMGQDIDALGARSMITPYSSSLDLLLAPTNPTDVEYISGDLIGKLLESIAFDYDYIVIDTPPAFTDFVLRSMELMDACFLITTLDMPAIKNLKIVLETLQALKMNMQLVTLVLNKCDSRTGITINEVEKLVDLKVDYKIPNDIAVSQATNQGQPVVAFSPKSVVSREVNRMASELVKRFQPITEPVATNKKRLGFFDRNGK